MNGWVLGYIIGGLVVLVVAVLAITLILQARKIGDQAAGIHSALDQARSNTMALWEVDNVNRSLEAIGAAARDARIALTGGGR